MTRRPTVVTFDGPGIGNSPAQQHGGPLLVGYPEGRIRIVESSSEIRHDKPHAVTDAVLAVAIEARFDNRPCRC